MRTAKLTAVFMLVLYAGTSSGEPDSLQCHKVKDNQKFSGATVDLDAVPAGFDLPPGCIVKGKAAEYCVAASTTVTSYGDAPAPPVAPASQDLGGNSYVCYKIKCAKEAVASQSVTDAFGFRELLFKPAGKLCVAATEGAVTTTTTTLMVDPCADVDGDGWDPCTGDCCESPGECGSVPPEYVNPGAYEVQNNGVDDDCNSATLDADPASTCSLSADFNMTAIELARAMDICSETTADPPLPQKGWGLISASLLLADGTTPTGPQLVNMTTYQTAALENYGNVIVPRYGATMAGLSSGRMRDTADAGWTAPSPGTDYAVYSTPPLSYTAAHGGSLPSTGCGGACPTNVQANDPVNLSLSIRVPTNAISLSFDVRYFYADYDSWYCTVYNDAFLGLLTSSASNLPTDRNIVHDALGNAVTSNNVYYEVCAPLGCHTCPSGAADLSGTGMDTVGGGGSNWITATAPVVPGETITLDLMVFDNGDNIGDSVALIDQFRWGFAPGVEAP